MLYDIDHFNHNAIPVLINEQDMRRAAEKYCWKIKNLSIDEDDCEAFIDKNGEYSSESKLWIHKYPASLIRIERKYDYNPDYIHMRR